MNRDKVYVCFTEGAEPRAVYYRDISMIAARLKSMLKNGEVPTGVTPNNRSKVLETLDRHGRGGLESRFEIDLSFYFNRGGEDVTLRLDINRWEDNDMTTTDGARLSCYKMNTYLSWSASHRDLARVWTCIGLYQEAALFMAALESEFSGLIAHLEEDV